MRATRFFRNDGEQNRIVIELANECFVMMIKRHGERIIAEIDGLAFDLYARNSPNFSKVSPVSINTEANCKKLIAMSGST